MLIISCIIDCSSTRPKYPSSIRLKDRYCYKLDDNFSNEEELIIIDSILEWNSVLNKVASVELSESENCVFVSRVESQDLADGTLATFSYPANKISIHLDKLELLNLNKTEWLNKIVLHEVGHSFKIDHSLKENTIMYPTIDYCSSCVTVIDAQMYCNVHSCDYKDLNYCSNFRKDLY